MLVLSRWFALLVPVLALNVSVNAADIHVITGNTPSPYQGCTATAGIINYTNSQVEPMIAVNPTTIGTARLNLVAVWQQDRWSDNGNHADRAGSSLDGGLTWHIAGLPFDHCVPGGLKYDRGDDPWVSIGPDGRAYASGFAITYPSTTTKPVYSSAVVTSTSSDGGRAWSKPYAVQTANRISEVYIDKDQITADPTRPGVAYLTWRQQNFLSQTSPLWFARTDNGGKTWSRPRVIIAAHGRVAGAIGGQILVAPRTDRLYCFVLYGRQRTAAASSMTGYIADVSSADGGKTWSGPHIVNLLKFSNLHYDPIRVANTPLAAIDPHSGELYVVWEDSRLSQGQYQEVLLSRSSDGVHWSGPIRTDVPDGHLAFAPAVAVNSSGVVGVTYYQEMKPAGTSLPVAFWFRSSTNGGRSFGRAQRVDGPFNLAQAPRMKEGYFVGDYDGLVSAGKRFVACFAVPNSGKHADRTRVVVAMVG